ncbi:phage tail protein [Lichenihabitans sp. PAMC28606]|uniref:phage tail protein n=1 Tax=Lichenihabitans sp. PAMC28606 TaxID=2880932 RepID=UPI001D0A0742|nr:phage tail protein [Lichenihabitans sp. PAMC28606]UDL95492.1 phage tail protein [Lichenihabitans sp. PAMC28606]
MSLLEVKVDPAQLERLANMIGAIGKSAPAAIARAVNHTGDKARTQMIRTLTTQTGLKRAVIVKALHVTKASGAGSMAYTISSHGGDISLKYFGARETAKGVSAAPFGQRQVFAGTFMKGGRFPKRVPLKLGGEVFQRDGASRLGIHKIKSGVYIPKEMVSGATAAAFRSVVESDLPDRLTHELLRAIGG